MNEVRKLQENPELGEFRISAALAQLGIYLSPRTCGRILAVNRRLYGLEKPKRGSKEKKEMPFQSGKRHEIWSVDVRYLDHHLPNMGKIYCISILDNHSRSLLASAVSTTQDLTAYLSVLYTAVERYGAPEILVSDGAGIFKANQAKRIYRSLGIAKEVIRLKHWKIYAEEGLARREVTLWLGPEVLTVEFAGEPLARYDVQYSPANAKLRKVGRAILFETSIVTHQPRLFDFTEALGEKGWLKALKLEDYAPRRPRQLQMLQEVLFSYLDAI